MVNTDFPRVTVAALPSASGRKEPPTFKTAMSFAASVLTTCAANSPLIVLTDIVPPETTCAAVSKKPSSVTKKPDPVCTILVSGDLTEPVLGALLLAEDERTVSVDVL